MMNTFIKLNWLPEEGDINPVTGEVSWTAVPMLVRVGTICEVHAIEPTASEYEQGARSLITYQDASTSLEIAVEDTIQNIAERLGAI